MAITYKTTISQIQLDNNLVSGTPLTDGQQLTITCPPANGQWSAPFGVWNNWNTNNAMADASPTVAMCPPGTWAISFYVKPSQWYNANQWLGSCWIGTITMTCSDQSVYTLDAQAGFNAGWPDGTVTQMLGTASLRPHILLPRMCCSSDLTHDLMHACMQASPACR